MIQRVVANDFLSWKRLDITIPTGVTLIDGWNEDDQTPEGSGKSAVLNAICWAFYGKIPKEANIDDVIKNGEKACGVEVYLSNAVVRRTRGPNELALIIGGRVIKGKDARETQVLIEEFIGLTFETFCQTIYFAQNYTKKFITSNQEEKGKILSEVQNLSVFDKAGKEVRELIKINEADLTKLKHSKEVTAKDQELIQKDINSERLQHEHAKAAQSQRIANLQNQITAQKALHQSASDNQARRIADLNAQIADAQRIAAEHESAQAQLLESSAALVYDEAKEHELQEANNQLMSDAGAINAELSGIDKLVSKRMTAESQGKRYADRYKQRKLEKEQNLAFIANPTKNCPTCGSTLEACDTSLTKAEVEKIDQDLAEIEGILTQLAAEIDAPIPTKDELSSKLADIRQRKVNNEAEIKAIREVKDKLNRTAVHLNGLERNIKDQRDRISKLHGAIEAESRPLLIDTSELEALTLRLEIESQPLVLDMAQLNALILKLDTAQTDAANLDNLIAEKAQHLSRLESLKDGFKEVKSFVFNSLLNQVNARAQKYLAHLFEVPVSVRFTNEDMKIETKVKFDGVDRGLGLLSGGQFRRVSLAVDLALSDVITSRKGAKVNLLILDEYFKDLSESSMEKCLALLENRGQPVLLIEHNSIFKNIVNNSVFVKLENGTSHVEIQNN